MQDTQIKVASDLQAFCRDGAGAFSVNGRAANQLRHTKCASGLCEIARAKSACVAIGRRIDPNGTAVFRCCNAARRFGYR